MDYGKTLNLPKTDFPMRANLPVRELEILKKWNEMDLYEKILENNSGNESFVFHDGPPYANGHIHQGTILNKILKDITVKYKNMSGRYSTFVPGWDCHGLPIELKADERMGHKKDTMDPVAFRKACRDYAREFVDIQREEFKRLGVLADWENPYITMSHEYESAIAHEFANLIESGALTKAKKPVYWCHSCETALAEAEVEYHDHSSPSIFVKFPLKQKIEELGDEKVNFVIWTTTPWTLPANLAVCLNRNLEYVALRLRGEIFIVANELKENFLKGIGEESAEEVKLFAADRFEGMTTQHPFIDRESVILYGDHVTTEAGTGCVHTAPGHGQEDYDIGLRNGLEPYAPVKADGTFTDDVELWKGVKVTEANPKIVEHLYNTGFLLNKPGEDISHSYPCCWRCNQPVIFRATPQWFVGMDDTGVRKNALESLNDVEFIPAWGKNRITSMVENRPNWCISRQRLWGSPIIAFSCRDCNEQIVDGKIAHHVADLFKEHTSDIWYEKEASYFLPEGFVCPKCGSVHIDKESDILDVWFDSGVSWASVLNGEKGREYPADLYLEGSDQHRGWFQSSLLCSTITRGKAPYKRVLTHGYVVDGKGEKISKSKGNFIPPEKTIKQMGAEMLRLWASAEDYRDDIRISNDILATFTTAYRKIRNTLRFMFGFINDFDPSVHTFEERELKSIDRWAIAKWTQKLNTIIGKYESYEYHRIFHEVLDFFTVDMSSFYLDVIKDRYVMKADDERRRMSQFTVHAILKDIVKVLAPVLSFTMEEAYSYMPGEKKESVFLEEMPKRQLTEEDNDILAKWKDLIAVRDAVQKVLEELRAAKEIGHSLDSRVVLYWEGLDVLNDEFDNLESVFICSSVEKAENSEGLTKISEDLELYASAGVADGEKCARCWKKRTDVQDWNEEVTGICSSCYEVIK